MEPLEDWANLTKSHKCKEGRMAHIPSDQRVKKGGAVFLDRRFPDWHRHVDGETLDITSCKLDVLGQLYGDYWIGMGRLKISLNGAECMGFHTITHIGHQNRQQEEEHLAEAWKQAIVERKTNASSYS